MTTEEQKAVLDKAREEVAKRAEESLPYLFGPGGIETEVKRLGNGVMHLTLRFHEGFVTDVVYKEIDIRKTFKKKSETA